MNATPIESGRDQTRFAQREVKAPNPSLICSSNSSGKCNSSSPHNFAPAEEMLRTTTLRLEHPLLKTQCPSRKHRARFARLLSSVVTTLSCVGMFAFV